MFEHSQQAIAYPALQSGDGFPHGNSSSTEQAHLSLKSPPNPQHLSQSEAISLRFSVMLNTAIRAVVENSVENLLITALLALELSAQNKTAKRRSKRRNLAC